VNPDHPLTSVLCVSGAESEFGRGAVDHSGGGSPFTLLLKSQRNVALGPRSSLQIPITFAPTEMRTYQARCSVLARREDGLMWDAFSSADHCCVEPNGSVDVSTLCRTISCIDCQTAVVNFNPLTPTVVIWVQL